MADFPMNADRVPDAGTWTFYYDNVDRAANLWSPSLSASIVTSYKMRGMDALTTAVYDTWLSAGAPDYAATKYTGALHTPLRDIIVIDAWDT